MPRNGARSTARRLVFGDGGLSVLLNRVGASGQGRKGSTTSSGKTATWIYTAFAPPPLLSSVFRTLRSSSSGVCDVEQHINTRLRCWRGPTVRLKRACLNFKNRISQQQRKITTTLAEFAVKRKSTLSFRCTASIPAVRCWNCLTKGLCCSRSYAQTVSCAVTRCTASPS